MKYFNWTNLRLLLVFGLVGFLFAFTSKRNEERFLTKSVVVFTGEDNLFVTREMVNKLLIENRPHAHSIRKVHLDLNKLEKSINKHLMVEKSEVFVSLNGVLKAVVKQKTPIARVFTEEGSFYLDYKGNKMPLSDNYAARVPIIYGDVEKGNTDSIADLLRLVHDDQFLKKNIIGATILEDGSVKMTNRNYGYEIDFGKPMNMKRKFNNYKAFFQKAVSDSTIKNYRLINLRFTQQVVCTK